MRSSSSLVFWACNYTFNSLRYRGKGVLERERFHDEVRVGVLGEEELEFFGFFGGFSQLGLKRAVVGLGLLRLRSELLLERGDLLLELCDFARFFLGYVGRSVLRVRLTSRG